MKGLPHFAHSRCHWIFLQENKHFRSFWLPRHCPATPGSPCGFWHPSLERAAGPHCVLSGQVQNITLGLLCPRLSNESKASIVPLKRQYKLDLWVVATLRSSKHLFSYQSLLSNVVGLLKQSSGLSIMWSLSQVLITVISSSHPFHQPCWILRHVTSSTSLQAKIFASSCYFVSLPQLISRRTTGDFSPPVTLPYS